MKARRNGKECVTGKLTQQNSFYALLLCPAPNLKGKKAIERNKKELFAILLHAVCLADIHAFLCEEKNCIHNEMNQVMAISTQT